MKLTKQQIEALSDLYEVMKKHDLSFVADEDFSECYVMVNHKDDELYKSTEIDIHDVYWLLGKNKGGNDE